MLAEKKSLKRFLFVYVFSTIFLVGIGEYFYYKLAKNSMLEKEKIILENKINNYLKQRIKVRRFIYFKLDDNMAIFKDKELIASNFKVDKEIDFNKELWIKDNKLFYLKTLIRPFGVIYILTFKHLPKTHIIDNLLIFNLFLFIFLIFVAYLLGKIFLGPMKETIQNLENFITDSTHEMNTPISVILSNVELLKMKNIDNKELKRIENSSKRLSKIFNDLKFVRLNHTPKRDIKKISLKNLILERVEYFDKDIELDLEEVVIKIDKEEMTRVIDNLISNSIKYSNKFIKITLKKEFLLIENDGEIKNIKNIKNKFVRENKNEGGFGLGLYIVDKICDYYNFHLKIKSLDNKVSVYVYF